MRKAIKQRKMDAINGVYRMVAGKPRLLIDSTATLDRKMPKLKEIYLHVWD